MKEFILFSIENNKFALELDKIIRVVQAMPTRPVAGNAPEIEGIFTFEGKVLNVVDFRKLIHIPSYADGYDEMFASIKKGHIAWVEALEDTVEKGVPFTKALNPHECALGKWLDSFNSYDDKISHILDDLFMIHANFHGQASKIIATSKKDKSQAHEMIQSVVEPLKEQILSFIEELNENKELIANSMQKFLILDDGVKPFAVRIDAIDDIVSVDEATIQFSNEMVEDESYVKIEGIFEHNEQLINLVQSIELPSQRR